MNNNFIITMAEFLYNYFGIEDLNVFSITHEDIKVLFPELKRFSITELEKDLTLIYKGDVILVKDKKGFVLPYCNPLRYLDVDVKDLKEIKKPTCLKKSTINIDTLTNYQLKKEYLKDKRLHKYSLCRVLKKEMNERNIEKSSRKKIRNEKYKGEFDYD